MKTKQTNSNGFKSQSGFWPGSSPGPWVPGPFWLLAGLESQHVRSSPKMSCVVSVSTGIPVNLGLQWVCPPLFPQCPKQYLTQTKCSIDICCEIKFIFHGNTKKFKHEKNMSTLWPLLSPLLWSVYLHYAWTKPPHWQKYLLSHKEQHLLSISETTP